MTKIGVISDTHGLLRDEAAELLADSDIILHAGDIGNQAVIVRLQEIAPVVAIRGNVDKDSWAASVPEQEAVEIGGKFFYLIHNVNEMNLDPAGQFDVVVSGHSHKPGMTSKNGVLYFNPGSAGPRRFSLPIALGKIEVADGQVTAQIVEIEIRK